MRLPISIELLPTERSSSQVTDESAAVVSFIPTAHSRLKTKSPSPLPSLTPSPPPVDLIGRTSLKRSIQGSTRQVGFTFSPSAQPTLRRFRQRAAQKRARRSPPSDDEYFAGPSGSSSGSDDEYQPAAAPRLARSSPMASTSRSPAASGSKQYYCIVKGCRSDPFSAPKDRNRHMDTHFGPRFRCPGC